MSQNYLASRSSNLSSFNAIAMNYSTLTVSTLSGVSTLNVSRVITTSTIQVNSSMISLGNSTNQVYVSSLSYGNFSTSTKWNTSMIDLLSTATIAMSANAQYQMTVSPSTTVSSIMYTSTLGQSWTTISAATGLPSATATSYTAGAISGDGQYAALGAYGGYLYRTANSGATWTNTNLNAGSLYAQLAFEGNTNDVSGNGRTVNTSGSITYVPGIVGSQAGNISNTAGGSATNFIRIPWTTVSTVSISFWFYAASTVVTQQTICSLYSAGIVIYIVNSQILVQFPTGSGSGTLTFATSGIISTNAWYNIALIFQSGGACSFYVNNVLIQAGTSGGLGSFSSGSGFIGLGCVDTSTAQAFNGYIDDFKIYNSAITFTPMVPQNWSSTAISNTGQYMLATATGAGLYMSSNFGSTWTQVTGAMLNAIWSNVQVSATGQYMLVYAQPIIVQPQLTGLTGNTTTATPVATSWQTNGITWTSNSSSVLSATFQSWCAFNNVVPPNSSSPSYSWASAGTYNTANGAYTGSVSTTIISPGPGAYAGEWIQIQSSVPIVIYSYNFACAGPVNIPKTYFIIGSNDGTNWYPIQSVSIGTNPFTTSFTSATSSPIIVNQSGSQTMTAGTSGTLTCTTYTTNTTAAYTYFRFIANTVFQTSGVFEFAELYLTFQAAGGQTYSTNYGSTWNNGYALPTPTALSLSESGQYAIGANNSVPSAPVVYVTNNFLQGFSTGTSTTPTFQTPLGTGNNPVASAVSNTGQYMVLITNNTSGNNVYYSINYGAYFAAFTLGTQVLTSCAISYDGSYITVSNATTTWTLNNNSNGFSVALGNQAGYQNQGQNAIAIGNYAGYQNQTANSIILNASGTTVNAVALGFYVAPIASYTASSSQSFALLGYGTGTGADNQITQGIGSVSTVLSNIFLGQNAGQSNTTGNLIIYIGQNVGVLNTTGYQNVVIGQDTGAYITTAYNTTAVGISAGKQLTTAYNNCFFGTAAGANTTTGSANTFLGVLAGAANTTGNNNVCIGSNSGEKITTGGSNTIVGNSTASKLTTGIYNIVFGNSCGGNITTGSGNTIIGWNVANNITSGYQNIYIGYNNFGITTGNNNIILGTNIATINGGNTYSTYIGFGCASLDGNVAYTYETVIGGNAVGNGSSTTTIYAPANQLYFQGYTTLSSLQLTSGGRLVVGSDIRLKTNISYLSPQGATAKLLQLKPCTYNRIDEQTDHLFTGFIADDVMDILPSAVDGRKYKYEFEIGPDKKPLLDDNGNVVYKKDDKGELIPRYLGFDYNVIVSHLVLGFQEQTTIIQDQHTEISALKQQIIDMTVQQASEITDLKSQLAAITQRLAAANIA